MSNISLFKPYLKTPASTYKGGKSRDEIKTDKKLYKLSSNENLLGPSPLAIQAMQDHLPLISEYPDRTGMSLQVALSTYYGYQMSPDQFFTANSGIGIIELIVNAFLGEGRECIVSNPAFAPYIHFPEKTGTVIKDVPLIGEDYHLDIEGIVGAITDKTRVVWVCSPNNPMGTYIPKEQIETLISRLPDHVVLVYDEVYYHFATAKDYVTGLPYVLEGKNIIAINSFSKAFGLAGLRIGYAYSTPEIARYVSEVRRPFLLSTLALEAAKAALVDTDFLQRTQDTISRGKAYLYPHLDRLGVNYLKSQANFITLKPEMGAALFEEKMLEQGIMVRPVGAFGAPDFVRVTIGTQEANEAYITALEKVLTHEKERV